MQQIIISHLDEISLDPESDWVKVTDLMGREYLLDPKAALELAIWVAEHHEAVEIEQAKLELARRMEEASTYGPLLGIIAPETPHDPPSSEQQDTTAGGVPRKRRRTPRTSECGEINSRRPKDE